MTTEGRKVAVTSPVDETSLGQNRPDRSLMTDNVPAARRTLFRCWPNDISVFPPGSPLVSGSSLPRNSISPDFAGTSAPRQIDTKHSVKGGSEY